MSSINLPWPIFIHAIGLVLLGLARTFRPGPPGPVSETSTMLGIATAALGVAYLSTAYMPVHENQFLHASVPVRLLLASIAGLKALVSKSTLSKAGLKPLLVVVVYDGLGGAALGWWLGTWGGRVAAY